MKKTDKFTQLVNDLDSGKLSLIQIQLAVRSYIRHADYIPEETKSILCGDVNDSGLIFKMFALMKHTIGEMELAVRRAKDSRKMGTRINDKS